MRDQRCGPGPDFRPLCPRLRASAPGASTGRRSFGIGLALVREIASAAGGTVKVARTGPDGTTMELALPLA
ncbi:ATP-binding protein [Arthrobacter sedimenti]|uniref:ATP-binding protein n=1 Tax=Arthrobacter sedimenti TaxID=2694931 RepID=A0ABV8WFG6_9MICC